jgi:hypothetical protein
LPHGAALTRLIGKQRLNLKGNGAYSVQLKAQEIITMHFQTAAPAPGGEAGGLLAGVCATRESGSAVCL